MFGNTFSVSRPSEDAISHYFSKVYAWMSGALIWSATVAWYASQNIQFMNLITAQPMAFYGMLIAELVLVVALAGWVKKMSVTAAMLSFIAYATLTGLTLSTLFLIYTNASIAKTLVITGGVFAGMSVYGFTTKKDLTSWGSFLIMSLFGLIFASIVNIFLNSYMLEWITTYAGILIFVGLTAYDTQKLKHYANAEGDMLSKMAILGALTLYLDFVNLFLYLLRVMGNRK